MSKGLDPFLFLLISLAGWMNQQWPISTRPIKPHSHDRSHAGISHERLARRRYAPCPRFWRLLFDPRSFRDTLRLANPEVSDGDVTLGWPWDSADRVFGPYEMGKLGGPAVTMPEIARLAGRVIDIRIDQLKWYSMHPRITVILPTYNWSSRGICEVEVTVPKAVLAGSVTAAENCV